MKTCKTGCGKMKAGGSVKKVKKMATGGQALNKAKGFAKPTTGGDNVSKQIYGVPNAGTTGPNRTATYDYKKGGAIKKYPDGGSTIDQMDKKNKREIMRTPSGKLGVGASVAGIVGVASKAIADKIKANRAAKKTSEEKKKKDSATPKAKFGATVGVQRGYPGKIRSADDQGYTAIGKREPARTKFQKGGSTYLGGPSGFNSPGAIAMRADNDARSKYYTPDNIRKEGIKLSDKEIEKKVKVAKDSLYNKYMKDAKLTPEKKSTTKKPAAKKMATGGSLKPVPADKGGLAKLPTAVRNKMGFQKKGGSVKKK
jgi:hypothetical protein